jgi:hypothetical protein
MAQLNDTEELRRSLEKILELSLKTAQRLSTVLEECSTRMTDEDERLRLTRERSKRVPNMPEAAYEASH